MLVRPARHEDVPLLRDLVLRAYRPYVARIDRRPAPMQDDYAQKVRAGAVFVADDGGVVGLIVLIHAPDHLLIENVAVAPERQGSGIGRALMAHAEAHARERGLGELRLYTNAAMTENISLYRQLGYSEVERRREEGFERVFFAKATPRARAS